MNDTALVKRAKALWDEGTFASRESAISIMREVCAPYDAEPELIQRLCGWLLELGYAEEAAALLRMASDRDPTSWPVWVALAHALEDTGDLEGSLAAYENSLSIREKATTLTCAASVAWRVDQDGKAENLYRRALAIEPDNDEALVGLGLILREKREIDEARKLFAKAVEVCPDSVEATRELALLTDDLDVRISLLRRATTLKPTDFWAWLYLGMAYVAMEDYSNAEAALLCADELDEYGEPLVFKYRAIVFEAKGNMTGAKALAIKAREQGLADADVDRIAGSG